MASDSSHLPNMHCKVIDGSLLGYSEVPGPESSVPVPKVSLSLGQLPRGLCAQAGCAAVNLGAGRTVFGAALTVVLCKAPREEAPAECSSSQLKVSGSMREDVPPLKMCISYKLCLKGYIK